MSTLEYLVSYGLAGDFGRFRAVAPLACRRAELVVVHSHRGLEVGSVLRQAVAGHATFLPNTTLGQLLRRMTPNDERKLDEARSRSRQLLARGVELVDQLGLPLEMLDAEVLLDGEHAALHLLRFADCDVRPLVATLSRELSLHIHLADLSRPKEAKEEDEHGCGRDGCGSEGNCGSCGTGGGCGSCSTEKTPVFAQPGKPMENQRVGLL